MDNEVREGFLCPICMTDLGSFHKLQNHFETSHTAEDKAVLDQIKGLFSKAKGKFLKKDEYTESSSTVGDQPITFSNPVIWEPQEFGATRSHMDRFRKLRDARIDRCVIESNKVLIRLDKLISQIKLTGKENSKEYERNLVPWVKDADVPFCPTCGDRFNISRRRHHCRLCGAIMCTKCSLYISYEMADEMVQTLRQSSSSSRPRSHSTTVNNTQVSVVNTELQIRCCHECYKILLQRKRKTVQRSVHKLLVLLYEKLQNAMESATKNAPKYQQMADSLNQGDDEYDLSRATEMRFAMVKYYETVDVVSKKIAALDTNDTENPPSTTALRLQMSIRQNAHAYLQENMLVLQSLPSLPKLEVLQKKKREELEKKRRERMLLAEKERAEQKRIMELNRLQQEQEASAEKRAKSPVRPIQNQARRSDRDPVVLDRGWSSSGFRTTNVQSQNSVHVNSSSGNPLLEQINYVGQMIKQAEQAKRHEEARCLTLNLLELQREYEKQESTGSNSVRSTTQANNPFLNEQEMDFKNPKFKLNSDEESIEGNPFLADEEMKNPVSLNGNKKGSSVLAHNLKKSKFNDINGKNPFCDDGDDLNPFLDTGEENNPFLGFGERRNPFLDDKDKKNSGFVDAGEKNPFSDSESESNPFQNGENKPAIGKQRVFATESESQMKPSSIEHTENIPLLEQICYVTKRLDEAYKKGKTEEIAIFKQNLKELQEIYNG